MGKIVKDIYQLKNIIGDYITYCVIYNQPCKIVMTSGGYSIIHSGHASCIYEARKLGICLIVIVNDDEWLKNKYGFVPVGLEERMRHISFLQGVDYVVPYYDGTINVAGAIRILKPDIFAKGGDVDFSNCNSDELIACNEVGCKLVFGIGGNNKVESSSNIMRKIRKYYILG